MLESNVHICKLETSSKQAKIQLFLAETSERHQLLWDYIASQTAMKSYRQLIYPHHYKCSKLL